MKKITLICLAILLIAISLNNSAVRGLMNWLNTPAITKAEIAGKDGALTVTVANTVINKYAVLAADASAGASTITVTNPGGANGLDPSTLTAGDLLLVIQMAGVSINNSDTANFGTVTNLNNAGRHEYVTVSVVSGNVITINPPCTGLRFSYTTSGKVQVIRVPQYTTLTVNSGASLTGPAWNGQIGGIVAVHVQNNAIINGSVDVSALGFRGAPLSAAGGGGFRSDYRTTQQDFGAEKGEGIAGYGMEYDFIGGRYGRGAAANAGGGATAHNSGGGGGANGANGNAYTGQGVMDPNPAFQPAWALDPSYAANGNALTNSSGGGRGGYSYSVNEANALTTAPGNPAWDGDNRREVGGLGGRPVPQDTSGRIFIGGGGGAGAQNNDAGGAGGNGGGLIYIIANNVSGSGVLRANGANGGNTRNQNRDGSGGAGAGGTIIVAAKTLSGLSANADGGNGGNQSTPTQTLFPNEAEGPGGGGGGGFIAYTGGSITLSVKGGVNGTTQATSQTEFTPNGATRGANGVTSNVIPDIPFCSTYTDLSITKTNNKTAIVPGMSTTYTIVVTNNGPNAVFGVPVNDNPPSVFSNITWSCAASAGSRCFAPTGAGPINTKVDLLANGAATFQLTATANPSATGTVTNMAKEGMPDGAIDTNPNNDTATDTDPFTPQADLLITKTNGVNSVTAGTTTTYSIVVANNGPSTVTGATVTDPIPANLTNASWICSASTGASCGVPNGTGNINATVNLMPGSSVTFTLTATVINTAAGSVTNTATVISPPAIAETNTANNSATDTDIVAQTVDLAISKTNNTNSVTAGANTTYTIVATNNGPSAVNNAPVTDALPANLTNATWTCAASNGSSCGAANGSGAINTTVSLLPSGTATFTLTATVSSTAAGTITNTATIATPGGVTDSNPGNNSASDTDTVARSSDLAILKVANSAQATPGAQVNYRIEVTNNGPSAVTGAPVTDTLPATLSNASWACIATSGSSCGSANGTGNINTTVNLLVGGKATFNLTATLSNNVTGTLTNTASVNTPSGTTDPNGGNNSSTSNTPITPTSDLRIVKTASQAAIRAGDEVTYTINVTNMGPSSASNVKVTDTLQPGLILVSATPSQGSCTGTDTITCNLGAVGATAPDNTATVTIKVRVPVTQQVGPLTNIAIVETTTPDPNPNNNSSSSTVTVNPPPGADFKATDVSVRNTTGDVCISGSTTINVEVKLTNKGEGTQRNNPGSEFLARFPVELSGVAGSCTASTGLCTIGSSQVEWNGEIAPGQTVRISYRARVRIDVQPGTRFCTDFKVNYDTNSDGVNDATTTSNNCLEANCAPPPCNGPDCPQGFPGEPFGEGPDSISSDVRPGSVLIFPYYSSDAAGSNLSNTRISITNTDQYRPAYLHLFFVDGSTCTVADNFLCLTPNQTTSFLASDIDPGVAGYLIAIAVDNLGCPVSFNKLIGEEHIKLSSGHFANLGAIAVPAISPKECDLSSTVTTLKFDGVEYNRLGRVLALDNVPSVADGNSTLLVLDSIGGDFTDTSSTLGQIFGLLYNDQEISYSFNFNPGVCQLRQTLSSTFPRSSPRFTEVVPAGRSGWVKLALQNEGAMVGVMINANPNPNGLRGGHNLHMLTLGNTSLTIPLIAPPCQ